MDDAEQFNSSLHISFELQLADVLLHLRVLPLRVTAIGVLLSFITNIFT